VPTGSRIPSTVYHQMSPEFKELFDQAPLIISKGQGNFEGLSGMNRGVFFLLKAICVVVARALDVRVGDLVLKRI